MLTLNELRTTLEALETAYVDVRFTTGTPAETVKKYVETVGLETATYCVAAMVRQASWDGRISRTAKEWAASIKLPEDWERRIDHVYSDRIHKAHLSQLAEAMAEYVPETEAGTQPEAEREDAEPETPDMGRANSILATARHTLETRNDRSAWDKGVTVYALELLEELQEAIDGGYFFPDDLAAPKVLEKGLLNGAGNWHNYSWGGCSLIYDGDIAARLCTPSELKRNHNGERRPNNREEWLDVQADALHQASRRVMQAVKGAIV